MEVDSASDSPSYCTNNMTLGKESFAVSVLGVRHCSTDYQKADYLSNSPDQCIIKCLFTEDDNAYGKMKHVQTWQNRASSYSQSDIE